MVMRRHGAGHWWGVNGVRAARRRDTSGDRRRRRCAAVDAAVPRERRSAVAWALRSQRGRVRGRRVVRGARAGAPSCCGRARVRARGGGGSSGAHAVGEQGEGEPRGARAGARRAAAALSWFGRGAASVRARACSARG